MGITGATVWVIGLINLLLKSPDPPSNIVALTSSQDRRPRYRLSFGVLLACGSACASNVHGLRETCSSK